MLVSNYPEAPSLHYAGLPRVLQPGHQVVGDGELGFQVVGGHLQWTVARLVAHTVNSGVSGTYCQ